MKRKKVWADIRQNWTILFWAALAVTLLALTGAEEGGISSGEGIQVVAHRAGAASAPENTLAALENAVEAGADMVEIDVRMTRDGVLVVMHDGSLERTTGENRNVWETDCAAIRNLDAGGWYSGAFAGEPVPTLEEMLKAAEDRVQLMIELKCSPRDQELVERTVEQIQAAGMENQCALACTDLNLLRRSKELAPELDTIFVGNALCPGLCGLDYVDGYNIRSTALTQAFVNQAHKAGKRVYIWTINSAGELDQALRLGIDGVVTDDPELAVRRTGD